MGMQDGEEQIVDDVHEGCPPEALGTIAGFASALVERFCLIEATHQLAQAEAPCSRGQLHKHSVMRTASIKTWLKADPKPMLSVNRTQLIAHDASQ